MRQSNDEPSNPTQDKRVKRYEALIILHNPTKEDGIKEAIDLISQDVEEAGGRVETVQKMDRKPFSRVVDKRVTSGFYVNVIFEAPESSVTGLMTKISGRNEVYRATVTIAPKPSALQTAAA